MTEPTNTDVLDAVTLELSRFTRDVVAEMHRLRDELAAERQRTKQLESTVTSLTASLRKFDTQAATIVDYITKLSADVDRRLGDMERTNDGATSPEAAMAAVGVVPPVVVPMHDEPAVRVDAPDVADDIIQFAPLTLTLDPVEPESPHDSSIDDLVARVVGAIDAPMPPPSDQSGEWDRVEAGHA